MVSEKTFTDAVNRFLDANGDSLFIRAFRLLSNKDLHLCYPIQITALESIMASMTNVSEEGKILVESKVLDAIALGYAEKGSTVAVCLEDSVTIAKGLLCKGELVSLGEQRSIVYATLGIEYTGEDSGSLTDNLKEYDDSLKDEGKSDPNKFRKQIETPERKAVCDKESMKVKELSVSDKEILDYYSQYCEGVVQELLKRYEGLFASGYEVVKPAGVLTKEGIVCISGSIRKVYECSVATSSLYSLLLKNIPFKEVDVRSVVQIANTIYEEYNNGSKKLLYFPNKMLEFAYGLEAPTGENQNSLNTYNKHTHSNSWAKYSEKELLNSLRLLVNRIALGYVKSVFSAEDQKNLKAAGALKEFLMYVQNCLSVCLLMPEYKVGNVGGIRDVASFKLRICDPLGCVLGRDLTPIILREAFIGGVGSCPYSYKPSVDPSICVVEYAHEFNHNMAQSTPLFAYKALQSIKEQGMGLSFENLILGLASNGSILKGGTHGVDLSKNLTHNITAGSQAGKGVMTLNILASGIASHKNIIYLDRKPDMASLFKHLAPGMPVINGGDIQKGYDTFNQWQNMSLNVPDEVVKAFNVSPTWNDLGDLVYMRLLKLAIAVLMIRGSSHTEECFGGKEGLLIIVDEFSNFQRAYMNLFLSATSCIPPLQYEKAVKELEANKMSKKDFDRVYNNASYYALSYLNSVMADLDYLKVKKDAGYDPLETARSDVFVIGQSLEQGMFNYDLYKDIFKKTSASGRYKSFDASGLKAGSFQVTGQGIPFNIVNFKTSDAFFGRNMDDGRERYLAQTSPQSNAYGRLDDKASNFAYLSSFSEEARVKLTRGSELENIKLANSCVYFKPFLILNTSGMNDPCVLKMLERVETNAGISREDLIAENVSYNDPNIINEAVGFIDYIKMAGVSDVKSVLEKSSNVLNYVVQDVLRYPGDWFQFVTDLSPEWLFTIKDVVDAVEFKDCALYNPMTNPILQEYVEYNPERFKGNYEDSTALSNRVMEGYFYDGGSSEEDYSDIDSMSELEDERLSDAMGDNDVVKPDEEIDLDYTPTADIGEGKGLPDTEEKTEFSPKDVEGVNKVEDLGHVAIEETGKQGDADFVPDIEARIQSLLEELAKLGYEIPTKPTDNNGYKRMETRDNLEDYLEGKNYGNDFTGIDDLSDVVTKGVIRSYGGYDRITSFSEEGGSISINNCLYRCTVGSNSSIPYDIRRELNAGSIARVFDYSVLSNMHRISYLSFSSASLVYDYVSPALGFGVGSIHIDKYFDKFRNLQTLKIQNKVFTREDYRKQIEDGTVEKLYYIPKRSTQLANLGSSYLSKAFNGSWGFTKRLSKRKDMNKLVKGVCLVGGVSATAVTGTLKAGTSVARRAISSIKEGIKDLLNT